MGAVAEILDSFTSREADVTGPNPILHNGNIKDGRLEHIDLKLGCGIERLILQDGELLINRTNSPEHVGKAAAFDADYPMTIASYLIHVRSVAEVAERDFAEYSINIAWDRMWARHVKTAHVSQPSINGTKLGAMPLPLPQIEAHREIERRALETLATVGAGRDRLQDTRRVIKPSFPAVLAKGFVGKVVALSAEAAA